MPREADARRVRADGDAFDFQDPSNLDGDIFVLAGNQARCPFDHGDAGAEPPVHLRELEADVAAADDHEMPWDAVERQDCRVRQDRDVADAWHVGDQRAAADVDEDARGRQLLLLDADDGLAPRIGRDRERPYSRSMFRSQRSTPERALADTASARALTFGMSTWIAPGRTMP